MKRALRRLLTPSLAAIHIAVAIIIAGALTTFFCRRYVLVEFLDGLGGSAVIAVDPCGRELSFAGYVLLTTAMALRLPKLFRSADRSVSHTTNGARLLRAGTAAATLGIAALLFFRGLAIGNFPAAGMADTLLLTAALSSAMALSDSLRSIGLTLAALACGAALVLAPPPGPIHPSLQTPLLGIHVCLVIIAYTLLGIASVLALKCVVSGSFTAGSMKKAHRLLYPAVTALTAGIAVGAYWADSAWGRYWSWDPKETWALITLLIYLVPLHSGLIRPMRRPRVYLIFVAAAFIIVLFTWFGVSYMMPGRHSYA